MTSETSQPAPRRAFVTGASTGIGAAIATSLAREGYAVALAGRNAEGLQAVQKAIEADGSQACITKFDLRDPDNIESALEAAWTGLGPCDVLVNCGGCTLRKPAVDVTAAEWDEVVNTNLRGSFLAAGAFARRLMAEKRPGTVVNIGSTHGLIGFANVSAYGISKAGLHHMTRMLAIEWAEHGIRVNAVAPGTTETPSRAEVMRDPQVRQRMLDRIPVRAFTTPEQVAAAVQYLVSPEASVITGQVLVLDGGLTVY